MHDIIQTAKEFGVDVEWAISRRVEYLERVITEKKWTPSKSKEYLEQKIAELKNDQQSALQLFSGNNDLSRFLLLDTLKLLNKEIMRCEMELDIKNTKGNRITQTDIEKAKAYPIENLLANVRNGKTNCISGNHEDRHPSMDIRNGFVYCYSCGWHGDVIAVYMKLQNTDFTSAVKGLNSF